MHTAKTNSQKKVSLFFIICNLEVARCEILKKFNISKMFIYRTIDRFSQRSIVDDNNRSGRARVVQTAFPPHNKTIPFNFITILHILSITTKLKPIMRTPVSIVDFFPKISVNVRLIEIHRVIFLIIEFLYVKNGLNRVNTSLAPIYII